MNKDEFKEVFYVHFDAIRNFIYYRCGDIEMASDIAQDVFLKVWEKRSMLNSHSVKSLLYKMAMDRCTDYYRKNRIRMNFEHEMIFNKDGELSPEDEASFRELSVTYAKALQQMPERQRIVFLMNREDGMKYAEIADCLNVSKKAVEKYISAALRFLKKRLL